MARLPILGVPNWKAALAIVACGAVALVVGLLYAEGSLDMSTQDTQPLAFSHKFHAGELGVSCLFCHRYAERSPVASIPSMHLCMSCHQNLPEQTPQTEKLLAHWNAQNPIEWRRLHRLPDFVYFTHEMHLHRGLQCVECHGRVDEMQYTPRASSFEMGWCLSCHQQQGGPQDCLTCHK